MDTEHKPASCGLSCFQNVTVCKTTRPLPFYGLSIAVLWAILRALNHFVSTQMNTLTSLFSAVANALAARFTRPTKQSQEAVPDDFKQHTNPRKNARRAAIKAVGGIRQFKKGRRAVRLASINQQF